MLEIEIKTKKYYKDIIKKYNSIKKVRELYEKAFRQYNVVGKSVETYRIWCAITNDISFENFFKFYLKYSKDEECFDSLASVFHYITNMPKNDCLDYLLAHAIYETYVGAESELLVNNNIKSTKDCELLTFGDDFDRHYAIDTGFKYLDKIYLVQIKPVSFFLGEKEDLIKDRQVLIKKHEKLKQNEKLYADSEIKFCIYKEVNNEFYFLKRNNKIFHTLDEAKYFGSDTQCFRDDFYNNDKTVWVKLD